MGKVLEVKNLEVVFKTYGGSINAVRDVSFSLDEGECLAIVGESGSGKSVTAKSILRLIPSPPGQIKKGEILFCNADIMAKSKKQMRMIRGGDMGMIFQDPMTSLNPTMRVGRQIAENIRRHDRIGGSEAMKKAVEALRLVEIPNPERRIHQFPHELSGGMRQRVMVAMSIVCRPKLLVADEPTTALDVTIQAQILDLIKDLQKKLNTAVILITHDMGVVANMAKRVLVMYAGKIVESGTTADIFYSPRHPYTIGLLKSMPRLDHASKDRLLSIEGTPPDLFSPPKGCAFAARCEYCMKICKLKQPEAFQVSEDHTSSCWLLHEKAKEKMWDWTVPVC